MRHKCNSHSQNCNFFDKNRASGSDNTIQKGGIKIGEDKKGTEHEEWNYATAESREEKHVFTREYQGLFVPAGGIAIRSSLLGLIK